MSASTEKKLRAKAREEGTDKKQIKAAEEAEKARKTKLKYTLGIIAVILFIAVTLFLNSSFLYKNTTALTIDGTKFSPAEVSFAYGSEYSSFSQTYGSYASMFGLDTSLGLAGLSSQECTITEDGGTWRDYFLNSAISTLQSTEALCKYAGENGIEVTQEEKDALSNSYDGMESSVKSAGYASLDNYLAASFGKGVNKAIAIEHDVKSTLAQKALMELRDLELENNPDFDNYATKNFRHILIKAVADEEGNYSDEAKAAAKEKCEELLEKWKAGDATEDSFAALATENTEDTGSSETGGLYTDSYKGQMVSEINDFIYEESRKAGDTAVLYSGDDAGYCGYHVVYFVGDGCPFSETSSGQSELNSLVLPKVEEMTAEQTVTYGGTMRLVGKG